MRHGLSFWRVAFLLALLAVFGQSLVFAQERIVIGSASEDEVRALEKEVADEVARLSQLEAAERTKVQELNSRAQLGRISRGKQQELLLHIKGKAGVKFEEPEIPEIDPETINKIKEQAKEKLLALVEQEKKRIAAKELLDACEKDERQLVKKYSAKDPKRKNYKDKLLIPKALETEDNNLAYGENVSVIVFSSEVSKDYKRLIAPFGFHCFPLRVHMGVEGVEILRGEPALRNYDEEPEGVLDKVVERQWSEFRRKSRLLKIEQENSASGS